VTEDDEIEASLRRIANGHGNELDRWRARNAERRKETKMTRNLDTGSDDAWNDWFDQRFDATMKDLWVQDIGETIAEARNDARIEFKALLHKLELEIAELRGELKGLRANAGKSEVVELPKMAWRRGDAA
jgi:hypothetical protein